MAITKPIQPVTIISSHELVKEFNYGERIYSIYKLEEARQAQRDELDLIEAQIKNLRSALPEDVVALYDEYRTCMKLRGAKVEPTVEQADWQAAQIYYQQMNNQFQMQKYNQGFQDYYQQGLLNQINQKFI